MIQIISNILLLRTVMREANAKRRTAAQLYAHDPDSEPPLSPPSDRKFKRFASTWQTTPTERRATGRSLPAFRSATVAHFSTQTLLFIPALVVKQCNKRFQDSVSTFSIQLRQARHMPQMPLPV